MEKAEFKDERSQLNYWINCIENYHISVIMGSIKLYYSHAQLHFYMNETEDATKLELHAMYLYHLMLYIR